MNNMYSVQNFKYHKIKNSKRDQLKYYVTKLECKTHEHQILDLKTRSVENNVIINGIEEKSIEGSNT